MDRYHRQILLPQFGPARQQQLARSSVLLIGCGALGTVIADQLVRAGIGSLRICDRDLVEITNLQRQVLFDEFDAKENVPKAVAAANRLRTINSTVRVEPHVVDANPANIELLLVAASPRDADPVDLILDGTDNVETRYLINDVAVKHNIPWVYGACVGTGGRAMGIIPGKTACLRCLFPTPPAPGELPTCDTAGVLAAAANVVASLQVATAFKILFGEIDDAAKLITVDAWPARIHATNTKDARRPDCPACGLSQFDFLNVARTSASAVLCGRNTVQLRPTSTTAVDLENLETKLGPAGAVQRTPFFVRCALDEQPLTVTIFSDGRILVHGTNQPAVARSAVARFIGM